MNCGVGELVNHAQRLFSVRRKTAVSRIGRTVMDIPDGC